MNNGPTDGGGGGGGREKDKIGSGGVLGGVSRESEARLLPRGALRESHCGLEASVRLNNGGGEKARLCINLDKEPLPPCPFSLSASIHDTSAV